VEVKVRRISLFAGLLVVGLAPGSALAADDTLSTRLHDLSSADLRSASPAVQADAVSLLNRGAGSLLRDGDALVVEIRTADGPRAAVSALEQAGAEITGISGEYNTVTASVDESDLRAVGAVDGVEYVSEVITPMTGAIDDASADAGALNTCATGVVSEGNTQLRAGTAKTQFDVDGSGVKVGVLSDSYDTNAGASTHAADDVASADLPGVGNPCGRTEPVQVVDDSAGPQGDEGRAMLQIVHDIAPGASLAFATAFTGETNYANNIRALAAAGAKVIVDDVIRFDEPMYQDGAIAKAVNDVTAQGVAYFSMAFNSDGLGVNSYEAPNGYRTMACPPAVLALRAGGDDSCMDFDPSGATDAGFDVTVAAGTPFRLSLSWAEAQFGVANDFDVYVFNPNTGGAVSLEAESDNLASQRATEFGSFTVGSAGNRQIVIRRYDGTGSPRLKLVSNDNGANTWQSTQAVTAPDVQGPTIYGHNGAAAAQTVGAVPFSNSNTVEGFSGRGPVTSIFEPVNGTTASPAFPAPRVLSKPDIAATDGGITTFFGSGNRFFGTSAAAPHAAAVGALQLEANPALTNTQVMAGQRATARPVGAFGPLDAGAGLIDAQAAIAGQPPAAPTVAIISRPGPTTTDTTPTFEFTTTGDIASLSCVVDGAASPCTSPFTTAVLRDGNHTVSINATDFFGQSGQAAATFATDASAPSAPVFTKFPKKKTKSKKATFEFETNEDGATFACSLDKKAFAPCASPAKVKVKKAKRKPKKHTFAVQPTDAAGNVGSTSTYKWKVVKKKRK
jgi:hypothetical protein